MRSLISSVLSTLLLLSPSAIAESYSADVPTPCEPNGTALSTCESATYDCCSGCCEYGDQGGPQCGVCQAPEAGGEPVIQFPVDVPASPEPVEPALWPDASSADLAAPEETPDAGQRPTDPDASDTAGEEPAAPVADSSGEVDASVPGGSSADGGCTTGRGGPNRGVVNLLGVLLFGIRRRVFEHVRRRVEE